MRIGAYLATMRDIFLYFRFNGMWSIFVIILFIVIAGGLVLLAEISAPFIYTLF